jgi:hypothetical protein
MTVTVGSGPTRQDTHVIVVTIANPQTQVLTSFGVWDTFSGGDVDSDQQQYYPGGMGNPVALGGRKTPNNVTVSRLYRIERDHERMQFLLDAIGVSTMFVHRTPLDQYKNPAPNSLVYRGILKHVSPPDLDSTQSGPALLSLEMTVDGFPTLG